MVLTTFISFSEVEVTGIDLSADMVAFAYERLDKIKNDKVSTVIKFISEIDSVT